MEAVARYIESQNQKVYAERGVILGDPMDRGLRCVSLTFCFTLFLFLNFCIRLKLLLILMPQQWKRRPTLTLFYQFDSNCVFTQQNIHVYFINIYIYNNYTYISVIF